MLKEILKKKLIAAVLAALTSCSLAVTAFAFPWDDSDLPNDSPEATSSDESDDPSYPEYPEPSDPSSEPVYPDPTPEPEILLNFYETTLTVGSEIEIDWSISNNIWGEYPPVGYYSSDPSVASVDENGFVTAVSEGIAVITTYCDTISATAIVTVVPAPPDPPEMQLGFYQSTIETGTGVQLTAQIANSIWENPVIKFESSDVNIVRVDSSGYIMGIGEGTAYVTASYENVSAYATIYVERPAVVPEYIVLKQKDFVLKIGASAQIEAQILPAETAEGHVITYAVDNDSIVSVSEQGLITALSTGTAEITVSGAGLTEKATVTVTEDIAYATAKLDGYLYNSEGNPVVGAQLVIDTLKAVSDTRGYFSFESVEQRELGIMVEGDPNAVCRITPQGDLTVYLLYKKNSPLTRLSTYEELIGQLAINKVQFVSGANLILTAGETFELEYQYSPRDVQVTEINYAVDNEIIADVGQIDGIVSAKAPGETDITITLNGGQAKASCHIVVNPKESTEHSVLIVLIETMLIGIAAIVIVIVYRSYKKKLNRTLDQYDDDDNREDSDDSE